MFKLKIVLGVVCFAFVLIGSNAQVSNLPLVKAANGGDTLVETSAPFTVHGRTFTPVNTVSVMWSLANNKYSVTGEVTSLVNFSLAHLSMGTATSYFTLHENGTIISYTPNVIDTFELAAQKYLAIEDETFLTYNTSTNQENIWGNVKVSLDGNLFAARMGSSDDPGGILQGNNAIKVWVHIEDLVNFKGLVTHEISNTDIILRHLAGDPVNTYYGYGNWSVFIAESVQLLNMGSGANPGMVVRNSMIDSIKMKGGGGGFIFGVLPVLDEFDIEYNHDAGKYAINGMITVGVPMGGIAKTFGAKYAPSFEINAGDENNPGFLLNPVNGKFEVANATFSLKRLNTANRVSAGGFEINDLTIGVHNNWPDSIYGRGTFPPGFSLGISLSFHLNTQPVLLPDERFYINSIGVTWEAANVAQAIPIGTTGFNIVHIGGSINNLLDYHNLSLTGSIGVVYGTPIPLDVGVFGIPGLTGIKNISIVYIEGDIEFSTHGISFSAIGDIGALFADGEWHGIIAELEGGITITWGGNTTIDASIKAYEPPYDVIDASASLSFHSSGDIDAIGNATLQVPPAIPVIGGKKIGSAHFATRHIHSDINKSFAAGWAKFNLVFDHITAGIKANFKSGKISKIGAAAARALTHQNISDDEQHPIGPDGEPDLDWYACGITHHFTLNSSRPPAYLQNRLVIENNYFHNSEQVYYSPAIATITSPSSTLDLKILTPNDPHDIYLNQGQTTPQDNTLAIDFTMLMQGGFDTINFITVNQAAEAYGSIDWVHQPDLLLTPGEYVLTVSGYCPVDGFPLAESNVKYNVSPVYPRPTINMTGNGSGTFTIDYSSYLTDSTLVSLYWNYDKGEGGNLVAHLPYYEGTLVGDSLYRWVSDDWSAGILPEEKVYFYAVIDDHINPPTRTSYDSVFHPINLVVNVYGGNEHTSVVLSPADTTLSDVSGINNGGGNFVFANVPLGEYTVQAYNADTTKSFNLDMIIWNIDGEQLETVYHSPDWNTIRFNVVTWDNGQGTIEFNLENDDVSLFGEVTDTSGVSLGFDAKIFLLDSLNNVVESQHITDAGYRFLEEGMYKLAVQLPLTNEYHWSSNRNLQYISTAGLFGIAYVQDSFELTSVAKGIDFRVYPGSMGPIFQAIDFNGNLIENVVITIQRQDGTGAVHQAITNSNGLAFFDGSDIATFTNYYFSMAWPQGYHTLTPQGQTFQWSGTTDIQSVVGQED